MSVLDRYWRHSLIAGVAFTAFLCGVRAEAQTGSANLAETGVDTVRLTLGEAMRRALGSSEEIALAESRLAEASEDVAAARSGLFPQVSGQGSYLRTIRSPFGGGGASFELPDSLRFSPDTTTDLTQRVRYLEQNVATAGIAGLSSAFSGLPFGQKNTYAASVSIKQTLFDPALFSGVRIAREFEAVAEARATEERLDLALAVIEAYYGAVLAEDLVEITRESAGQLQAQLAEVRLVRQAGNASDLDVLRVEVERQNLEPQVVAAQNARAIALLNLKRLINIPVAQAVSPVDELVTGDFTPVSANDIADIVGAAEAQRADIEAAARQVAIRRHQVTLAKQSFLPTVTANAAFGAQALPTDFWPGGSDFRDDWSVSVGISLPIFSGGRRTADVDKAQEQLRQAELQLTQLREQVSLEVEQQRGELQRTTALIRARAQTSEQAATVYELTRLAHERGLQTALQLSDARLQLRQARSNEAQALHDYYIALARLVRAAGAVPGNIDSRFGQTGAR